MIQFGRKIEQSLEESAAAIVSSLQPICDQKYGTKAQNYQTNTTTGEDNIMHFNYESVFSDKTNTLSAVSSE